MKRFSIRQRVVFGIVAVSLLCAPAFAQNSDPLTVTADSLLRLSQLDEAEAAYANVLKQHPSDAEARLRLGQLLLYANRLDDAEPYLKSLLADNPNDSDAARSYAELAYRRNDFATAAQYYRVCGQDGIAANLDQFAGEIPYDMHGNPQVTHVPFVQTDVLPLLYLWVNDRDSVLFILDTGGHELILDPDFAAELGIKSVGETQGLFAGGKRAAVGHGKLDAVQLGDFTIRNVPVGLLSTKKFNVVSGGRAVNGVLGTAILSRFVSTIDYPRGELVLRQVGSDSARVFLEHLQKTAANDRFWMAGTHFLLAHGKVNDSVAVLLHMDTGLAGASFTAPVSTFAAAGIVGDTANADEGVGGGGSMRITPVSVDKITMGHVGARNQVGIMGAFPPSMEYRFGFRIGGLVSHAFFRPYALTFDFTDMRYFLAP